MEETKICKTDFKKRGRKVFLKLNGYCDDKSPNTIINKEIELFDFDKLEEI